MVLLVSCGGDDDSSSAGGPAPTSTSPTTTTSSPATDDPELLPIGGVETVATGLEVPWGLAFLGDDTLLVTERAGRVRVVQGGTVRSDPALTLEVVHEGEGGLLGIAVHPEFPGERAAYLYYTAGDSNRVSRFRVTQDLHLTDEDVVLDGIPAARFHDGGRIAFGPDGLLYVTTGDAQQPERAADPASLAGKVLRVRDDGSVPGDNPFSGSPVYSYGHRNPQGLAWDDSGRLWSSEHGPTGEQGLCCHDEINLIEPGGFYGWPFRAGEIEAAPGEPPATPIAPVATSGSRTWAPAGLAVVNGPSGPSLLVAALAGRALLQFQSTGGEAGSLVEAGAALDGVGRLRAASIGPDGCLYLTTSNTDSRGDPTPEDDRILRSC